MATRIFAYMKSIARLGGILFSLGLSVFGAYSLHCAEFATKLLVFLSRPGSLSSTKEIMFIAFFAVVVTISLSPISAIILRRRVAWQKVSAAVLVLVSVSLALQLNAYKGLKTNSSTPLGRGNECPWFSLSGAVYFFSQVSLIPRELRVDLNNEQCVAVGLSLKGGTWDQFKAAFYGSKELSHYRQNLIFAFSPLVDSFISKKRERIAKTTDPLSEKEQARLTHSLYKESTELLKKHPILIAKGGGGYHPLGLFLAHSGAKEQDAIISSFKKSMMTSKLLISKSDHANPKTRLPASASEDAKTLLRELEGWGVE